MTYDDSTQLNGIQNWDIAAH